MSNELLNILKQRMYRLVQLSDTYDIAIEDELNRVSRAIKYLRRRLAN